jgi:hypothetical protein
MRPSLLAGFGTAYGFLKSLVDRAAPLAEIHERFIDGDARYPSGELGTALELTHVPVSLYKRLLPRIFGILLIASNTQC